MQDKNDDVSILQIPRRWFNFFSKVFISTIVGFTIFAIIDQFFIKIKLAQDFFDNRWLHRGSVLMTLIVGYIFIIARLLHRLTLSDSSKSYTEGRKAEREIIRDWLNDETRTSLTKREILEKLNELEKLKEVDPDP